MQLAGPMTVIQVSQGFREASRHEQEPSCMERKKARRVSRPEEQAAIGKAEIASL
jgi:hypothetical protein